MRKNIEDMNKEELQREWTWTLVEIALLLLAILLITIKAPYYICGAAAGLFTFMLLRPNRGGL